MAHYEIVFSGAGPFTQGQIVTDQQFGEAKVDLDRLKNLGAVREATAEQVKALAGNPATRVANAEDPGRAPENTTGAPRKDVSTAATAPVPVATTADVRRK